MATIGKDINKAKELLGRGELVAIPTETVYGLAGNALDSAAVAKIFQVKARPQFDPLIVHVPDLDHAEKYTASIPPLARKLAASFWPGPLTFLLPKRAIIPDLVTSGLDTVGIRCPDHPLTRNLLRELPFPLAAPSANPFGYVSPTTPMHVQDQLGKKIQYILDGGACGVGIESTIVGFDGDEVIVYRAGGLSIEAIEKITGKVQVQTHSVSNPKAPGQLKSHYAPRKKVIVGDIPTLIKQYPDSGVLSFTTDYQRNYQFILSSTSSIEEAARNLFTALRTLDKQPVNTIITEFVPNEGLGRAINDRLRRAAAEG